MDQALSSASTISSIAEQLTFGCCTWVARIALGRHSDKAAYVSLRDGPRKEERAHGLEKGT